MKRKRTKWKLPEEVQLPRETIDAFLARVLERSGPEDHAIARAHVEAVRQLLDALADKNFSIKRLRRLVFGPTSEKASEILQSHSHKEGEEAQGREGGKRKGHGRNGVSEYPGAKRIHVPHGTLRPGDGCPGCHRGKVYHTGRDGVEPRITGRPILEVIIWEPESLRCNLCGEVFRAELPPEAGTKKYDETAASAVALLKYGTGMPFRRLETLQETMGVPLPVANQWQLVQEAAQACAPAHGELQRQAARGDLLQNDDTRMKILGRKKKEEPQGEAKKEETDKGKGKKKRKGVVTTGIVSKVGGHTVVLYATGRRQAGENLAEVLKKRPKELGTPIQMADGLDANTPKGFATILANCNSHARRKFVEILPMFPQECREVIEAFRKIYHNDDLATGMSKEERLRFHQEHSGPVMKTLKEWLEAQLREKKVEPNSRLGKAFSYVLERWQRLTRFLEVAGTPLDNNLTERILKLAILHRKNALYYRTERGAWVGDVFMSLIQTARINGVNPFEYLTALQRNAAAVRERPEEWLPWNFKAAIAAVEARRPGGKGPATGPTRSEKVELRDTG
jgi:hypothetical protein